MTKTIAIAALTLTLATSAFAGVARIQHFVPGADLSGLSNAEVQSLLSVVHSGDTASEVRNKIRAMID